MMMSQLQVIPEVILSEICCINIGPTLNGFRTSGYLKCRLTLNSLLLEINVFIEKKVKLLHFTVYVA
jgi:hypothetical protein